MATKFTTALCDGRKGWTRDSDFSSPLFKSELFSALAAGFFLTQYEDVIKIPFVATDDVPRPIPALAQCLRTRFRFFPIAQHELRPAHDQFPRFAASRFVSRFIHHTTFSLDQRLTNRFGTIEFGF